MNPTFVNEYGSSSHFLGASTAPYEIFPTIINEKKIILNIPNKDKNLRD